VKPAKNLMRRVVPEFCLVRPPPKSNWDKFNMWAPTYFE
jgi:hypothetical protein